MAQSDEGLSATAVGRIRALITAVDECLSRKDGFWDHPEADLCVAELSWRCVDARDAFEAELVEEFGEPGGMSLLETLLAGDPGAELYDLGELWLRERGFEHAFRAMQAGQAKVSKADAVLAAKPYTYGGDIVGRLIRAIIASEARLAACACEPECRSCDDEQERLADLMADWSCETEWENGYCWTQLMRARRDARRREAIVQA